MPRRTDVCVVCGKTRTIMASGHCTVCHAYRMWQQRAPAPCARCGRLAKPFVVGKQLCKSCYSILRLNPGATQKGTPEYSAVRARVQTGTRLREKHWRWAGGKFVDSDGYVRVKPPEGYDGDLTRHGKGQYIHEHRLVAEQTLGRPLGPQEVVHHINRDRTDNRPENLMVLPDPGAHRRLHAAEAREAKRAQALSRPATTPARTKQPSN